MMSPDWRQSCRRSVTEGPSETTRSMNSHASIAYRLIAAMRPDGLGAHGTGHHPQVRTGRLHAMPIRTAVLGAGALGFTVALRLAQRRHAVSDRARTAAGGLAAGFEIAGIWLEKFYHHLFRSDQRAIAMIEELGLGERLH